MTRRERNRDLIALAQQGDRAAMEAILAENSGLIARWARIYQAHIYHGEVEDLMQVGRLGMIRAVEKFDLARDLSFATYANQWIRQAMRRMVDHDGMIRLPVHTQTREKWARYGNDLPTCFTSLDQRVQNNEDAFLGDGLAAPDDVAAEVIGDTSWEAAAALDALEKCLLLKSEREAMMLLFGLTDGVPRTLQEVGEIQGTGREAARTRAKRAVEQLRRYIERKGLPR